MIHLDVDENLRKLLAMLFHEIDKLDESSLAVKSSATLVVGGSVPDFPAVFWLLFWFFWKLNGQTGVLTLACLLSNKLSTLNFQNKD